MSENLYEIYKNILEAGAFFEFESTEIKRSFDGFVDRCDKDSADEFIKCFFANRAKSECLNLFVGDNEISFYEKSFHSISLFFLGLSLQEKFKDNFKNQISEINKWEKQISETQGKESKPFTFEYAWFMTSLYHDISSEYEKDKKECPSQDSIMKDISNRFINKIQIKRNIYEFSEEEKEILEGEKTFYDFTYSKETVENYYKYRLCNGSFDHGIVAGYIFYDAMVRNYLNEIEEQNIDKPSKIFTKSMGTYVLRFHPQQLNVFRVVADAIISHNMWHNLKCLEFDLSELNNSKLTLEKNFLTCFLGILDTIEPVKFFINKDIDCRCSNKINVRFILENISITSSAHHIDIIISEKFYELLNNSCKHNLIDDWFKKIKGLEDWINLDVIIKQLRVYIKLNKKSSKNTLLETE